MSLRVFAATAATALVCILSGCAAGMVSTSQSISSHLVAKEYNDIAAQFMDRPTFTAVEVMKDGSKVMAVTVNSYSVTAYGSERTMRFFAQDSAKYVAAIDKYFEWEKQALERKDIIEKEIAVVPAPNLFNISFDFHSGNDHAHYLSIGVTDSGLLGQIKAPILTFDHENAVIFRKLLVDLPTMSAESRADAYK